jgi:hypothetical protein
MHISGGVISGVAKATSPIREGDSSRPWRDLVKFEKGDAGVLRASDGFLAVQATVPLGSQAEGFLRRRDAMRVDGEDTIEFDAERGDGDELFHVLRVHDSELKMELEESIADGSAFPPEIIGLFADFPGGRPALRFDPRSMRRAMYALILAGVESCEMYLSPKIGNGRIYIRGTNDDDVVLMLVMGYPRTASRKRDGSDTVVEVLEPTPLFPGAEPPAAPAADPGEVEPPPTE